jgi:hypothetical protein
VGKFCFVAAVNAVHQAFFYFSKSFFSARRVLIIEEPGEQCTVVFAFSVQEPLVNVCACVYVEGDGVVTLTPPPLYIP